MTTAVAPPQDRDRFERLAFPILSIGLAANAARIAWTATARHHADAVVDLSAIAVALVALVAAGRWAERRARVDGALAFVIGLSTGFLFFAGTLGLAIASPTRIGWLLQGDWAQHYTGWAMFRDAPWHWPPGLLPEVWYPVGTSIVYTDSLPLLALALKPFSTWLPEPFQYIGPWMMASFSLQGAFGALLVSRFDTRPAIVLAGAALFVLSPVLLVRLPHDTLTAQWLLLAALCLYFRPVAPARFAADAWPWWLLTGVAALVHPYLAAMTLAIQLAAGWKHVRIDRARSPRAAAAAWGVSVLIALVAWWLAGAAILRAADSSGGVAFGRYSMNLIALVDPLYGSPLLPRFPVPPGQEEGFAYLGAGVIALLLVALVDRVRDRGRARANREWRPLAIVATALAIAATGGLLAIGQHVLADLSFQSRLLGAFRSTGRFVWVAYYALLLFAIVHVARRHSPAVATSLLGAALIVQAIDLSSAHVRTAHLRLDADKPLDGALADPRWQALAEGRHHLTALPPSACAMSAPPYVPMLLFAAAHGLTYNSGYLARWNQRETARYCGSLHDQLAKGAWSADDVYVVGEDWKARFVQSAPNAQCERLDGYDACVTGAPPVSATP